MKTVCYTDFSAFLLVTSAEGLDMPDYMNKAGPVDRTSTMIHSHVFFTRKLKT